MGKVKTYGPYTRLTPARSHLGGYSSLWMATDHLLSVQSSGYSDTYKRYYFRDIQGLLVEDSERRFYINITLGLVWAVFIGMMLLADGGWIPQAIFLLLFGVPLVINNVRGPSCKVYLVTQVQAVRLHALGRRARFERFVDQVRPLIEAAQADLVRPAAPADQPPGFESQSGVASGQPGSQLS